MRKIRMDIFAEREIWQGVNKLKIWRNTWRRWSRGCWNHSWFACPAVSGSQRGLMYKEMRALFTRSPMTRCTRSLWTQLCLSRMFPSPITHTHTYRTQAFLHARSHTHPQKKDRHPALVLYPSSIVWLWEVSTETRIRICLILKDKAEMCCVASVIRNACKRLDFWWTRRSQNACFLHTESASITSSVIYITSPLNHLNEALESIIRMMILWEATHLDTFEIQHEI